MLWVPLPPSPPALSTQQLTQTWPAIQLDPSLLDLVCEWQLKAFSGGPSATTTAHKPPSPPLHTHAGGSKAYMLCGCIHETRPYKVWDNSSIFQTPAPAPRSKVKIVRCFSGPFFPGTNSLIVARIKYRLP